MIDGIVKQEAEGEYVSLHCYNNTSVMSLSFFIYNIHIQHRQWDIVVVLSSVIFEISLIFDNF